MKSRVLVLLTVFAFALAMFGAATSAKSEKNQLAKLLPESDGVIVLDSARLFREALPQFLSSKPKALRDLEGKINEIEAETGLDLRKFNELALGVKTEAVSDEAFDFEPVLLARGELESKAVISVARLAADGKYREEKAGRRTIYIFSTEKLIEKHKTKAAKKDDKSVLGSTVDKMLKGLSNEVALAAFDEKTIAVGTLERVRETLSASPRVGGDVIGLLDRKPEALGSLGMLLPDGLSKYLKLGDDELGETLASIRQLQGALDLDDGNALVSMFAKTTDKEKATDLEATLSGLRMLGSAFLGNSKGADKQVYARMIEDVTIAREEDFVTIDLTISKTDIDTLVSKKK